MNNNEFLSYVKNLNRSFRIDSLDKLSQEIRYVNSEWIKAFNIDEGDLRLRELDIFTAFIKLELTEEWKKQNEEVVSMFICLADTRNVVEKAMSIFNLEPNSPSVIAAAKTLEKLIIADKNEEIG